ncbi:MAG: MFS transporter [Lachnospiraceae bacterium]|nr:MFS transporter [Lachnospiraceae bacterium]
MEKKDTLRIEANYAVVQGSYWMHYCAIGAFTAIYLTYRGLNNTQIGLTTSLSGIIGIIFQLLVSNYSDHHMNVPIKRIITAVFIAAITCGALLNFVALPVGLMIVAYAAAMSLDGSNNGFLNAQLVQFNNVGIPARYGWPRGVGSISYALAAYFLGIIVEKYTAKMLIPIFLVGAVICTVAVLFMPNPYKGLDPAKYGAGPGNDKDVSYIEMMKGNKLLVIYLICAVLLGAGQSSGFTFMIRVIESLGGGTAEYGISEFVRAGVELPMLIASPLLLRKYSAKSLVTVSFIFNGIKVWMAAIAPNLGFIYAMSVMNMLCSGIYVFASVMFVNSIVGPREKVRAQAMVVLSQSIGSILGNAYAGVMLDVVGLRPMLIGGGAFAVLAGVIMILFAKDDARNY